MNLQHQRQPPPTPSTVVSSAVAYQVDWQTLAGGRRWGGTKRRACFRFGLSNPGAMLAGKSGTDCRGAEHEVHIVWSLKSGKQLVLLDGREVHVAQATSTGWCGDASSSSRFEATFSLSVAKSTTSPSKATHSLRVTGQASRPQRNQNGSQFDFFIDGRSFFDLPRIYELGQTHQSPSVPPAPPIRSVTPPPPLPPPRSILLVGSRSESPPLPKSTSSPRSVRFSVELERVKSIPNRHEDARQMAEAEQEQVPEWLRLDADDSFNPNDILVFDVPAVAPIYTNVQYPQYQASRADTSSSCQPPPATQPAAPMSSYWQQTAASKAYPYVNSSHHQPQIQFYHTGAATGQCQHQESPPSSPQSVVLTTLANVNPLNIKAMRQNYAAFPKPENLDQQPPMPSEHSDKDGLSASMDQLSIKEKREQPPELTDVEKAVNHLVNFDDLSANNTSKSSSAETTFPSDTSLADMQAQKRNKTKNTELFTPSPTTNQWNTMACNALVTFDGQSVYHVPQQHATNSHAAYHEHCNPAQTGGYPVNPFHHH